MALSNLRDIDPCEEAPITDGFTARAVIATADPALFLTRYIPHAVVSSVVVFQSIGAFYTLSARAARRVRQPPQWWWRCVTTLDISATTLAFIETPPLNAVCSVTRLQLSQIATNDPRLINFITALRNVHTVVFLQNTIGSAPVLEALAKLPSLTSLSFAGAFDSFERRSFTAVSQLCSLRCLDINFDFSNAFVGSVRAPIEELTLFKCNRAVIQTFAPSLRALKIRTPGLFSTSGLPKLTSLDAPSVFVDVSGDEFDSEHFTHLSCQVGSDPARLIQPLQRSLRTLALNSCNDGVCCSLAGFQSLEHVIFRSIGVAPDVGSTQCLPSSLVSLSMTFGDSDSSPRASGVFAAAAALPRLQQFSFDTMYPAVSCGDVADLAKSPSLEAISVRGLLLPRSKSDGGDEGSKSEGHTDGGTACGPCHAGHAFATLSAIPCLKKLTTSYRSVRSALPLSISVTYTPTRQKADVFV